MTKVKVFSSLLHCIDDPKVTSSVSIDNGASMGSDITSQFDKWCREFPNGISILDIKTRTINNRNWMGVILTITYNVK